MGNESQICRLRKGRSNHYTMAPVQARRGDQEPVHKAEFLQSIQDLKRGMKQYHADPLPTPKYVRIQWFYF